MEISSRDISGKFATQSTSRRGKHLNIKGDGLLNITAHVHVYFCDLTDIGAEEEVDKVSIDSGMSWNVGRRIVELDILSRNMFCCRCNVPLHLQDPVSERVGGFGSRLYIRCSNIDCQTVTDVPTGKLGPTGAFDITDKIVIGKNNIIYLVNSSQPTFLFTTQHSS